MEVVGREDEAVRPAVELFELSVGRDRGLENALNSCADSHDFVSVEVCFVDDVARLLVDVHLFAVHLVLRQILDIYLAEVAESTMQGNEGEVHTLDFHHLHQLRREVQASRRSRHSTFLLSKDCLEVLGILRQDIALDDLLGDRRLAKGEEGAFELVVRTIEEEAERAAATGGIVYHLSHQGLVLAEVELVADTNLACRIDQHVPETHVFIQFAKQEDLNLGTCLLLVSVETSREDFGVVEHEDVLLVEVVEHISERFVMLDDTLLGMNHHESAVIAERSGFQGNTVLRKPVLELL